MNYGQVSQGPGGFQNFGTNRFLSGSQEFLQSNSLVAKFAFLIFVLIVFLFLMRMGVALLAWIFAPSGSPYLVDGMMDAKQMTIIPQNPATKGSKPVLRSVNQTDGLEFTWSVWIYIDDFRYNEGQYKHVFHKGNDRINQSGKNVGLNQPNNAPGLYIAPDKNDLVVIMNTFNDVNEEIKIEDVPLNKWVNVIIRTDGPKVDVYINGRLTKRHALSGVPKQNYGDVYVAMNGGFSGFISNLHYFNYAMGTSQIQGIIDKGPNLNMKSSDLTKSKPRYLSLRWFFAGNEDGYNP